MIDTPRETGCGTPRAVALDFIDRWSRRFDSLRRSIDQYFTPHTIWETIGVSRTVGIVEAHAFIDAYRARNGLHAIRAEIVAIAARGAAVVTRRIDRLLRADGSEIHVAPLIGIFEIREGRIARQRDRLLDWRKLSA